jgi:hypothetical protein
MKLHVRMRHSIACTQMSSTAALTSLSAALLLLKLPHYFDETTSSKPDLSQSVTPVIPSQAKLSRVCTQPCTTCTPFVMQGYEKTLCSLTMKRPDHPLIPMTTHLQTSHRLTSLPSSRKTNYWMPSRKTDPIECIPRVRTPKRHDHIRGFRNI